MSFIIKQMLSNINTKIEALQLEDINIGLGGAALEQSIAALQDDVDQLMLERITYAFQVTSNLNANQVMTAGVTAKFNSIEYNTPVNKFLTIAYKYIVPKNGLYLFGFELFINSTDENNFRM